MRLTANAPAPPSTRAAAAAAAAAGKAPLPAASPLDAALEWADGPRLRDDDDPLSDFLAAESEAPEPWGAGPTARGLFLKDFLPELDHFPGAPGLHPANCPAPPRRFGVGASADAASVDGTAASEDGEAPDTPAASAHDGFAGGLAPPASYLDTARASTANLHALLSAPDDVKEEDVQDASPSPEEGPEEERKRLKLLDARAKTVQRQLQEATAELQQAMQSIGELQATLLAPASAKRKRAGPAAADGPQAKRARARAAEAAAAACAKAATSCALPKAEADEILNLLRGAPPAGKGPRAQAAAARANYRERGQIYSNEELLECLHTAHRLNGRPVLSSRNYQAVAKKKKLEGGRSWPTYETIVRRFGGWARAFVAAGIPSASYA